MAKKKGVSSKTHTRQQLNDYANQNNPNNKAYKARIANDQVTKSHNAKKEAKRRAKLEAEIGTEMDYEWYFYSNPYDFD